MRNYKVEKLKRIKILHNNIIETAPSGRKYFVMNGNFRHQNAKRYKSIEVQ